MTTSRFKYLSPDQIRWVDEITAFCNADMTGRYEGLTDLPATRNLANSLMCDKSDSDLVRRVVNNMELEDAGIAVGATRHTAYQALVGRLGEDDADNLITIERRRRLRGARRPSSVQPRQIRR